MHAAPCASVSELYSADEVALLLEEIRELEPTSCRGEDVQDFEIAGSGLGGLGGVGGGCGDGVGGGGGGRSPCGTELTERSWDSHAHYGRGAGAGGHPPRLAPLYCRLRHLISPAGFASLVLALAALAACACVWAACGLRTHRLPLAPRLRALQLAALTSSLTHAALVFAHVSRLALLLPVDWRALRVVAGAWAACATAPPAALTLYAVLAAPEYRYAPPHIADLLLAAAGLGLSSALIGLVLALAGARGCWRRHRHCLQALRGPGAVEEGGTGDVRGAYRAVPTAPPPQPQPSTSRDHPL